MKNAITALCLLFALFAGCNNNPMKRATVTHYRATGSFATGSVTEVEWDIEVGETAQMALYCESIYITVVEKKDGKIKLLLTARKPT